jgi:hypothetical protein
MTGKYVLNKTFKWRVISEDGLLKIPRNDRGGAIFRDSYRTEEEAIADYQGLIDKTLPFPYSAVLIPEYEVEYVSRPAQGG